MAYYFDTSALVKLVVDEEHAKALRSWLLQEDPESVSSDLTRTELMRAVRRVAPDRLVAARRVLESVALLSLTAAVLDAAGRLEPLELRSLDAVHIAAALELGDDLEGIVAYDARLVDAATANGIQVVRPGVKAG